MSSRPYILKKGVSRLADLVDGRGLASPFVGNAYYVDPVNGSDGNEGDDPTAPMKTLATAYAKTTDNHNDVVFLIGSPTAHEPAATITWANSYTHLVGLSGDIPGVGQRCRIVWNATVAATVGITFSGNGCIVRNIQFNQEKASGASGVAIVSGSRNYFENCFFMTPTSATAASYSLKMSGSENAFIRCTIGQFTNARSTATYGLWLHGATAVSRNKFIQCEFLSWGALHDHLLVLVDADIVTYPWVTWFEDCLFQNNSGGGDTLTQAILDSSTATGHQIVFRGKNLVVGCDCVGTVLTYMVCPDLYHATASGLLAVTVAET
jgi:hypothetical protein